MSFEDVHFEEVSSMAEFLIGRPRNTWNRSLSCLYDLALEILIVHLLTNPPKEVTEKFSMTNIFSGYYSPT